MKRIQIKNVISSIFHIFFLLLIILIFLASFVAFRASTIERSSGTGFWYNMLGPHPHIMEETDNYIDFACIGVDTIAYFRVSREEVNNSYDNAVRARIEQLIHYMGSEDVGADYAADLHVLTGMDFGTKAKPWREWWSANNTLFIPKPNLYEKLKADRIDREIKELTELEFSQKEIDQKILEEENREVRLRESYHKMKILHIVYLVTTLLSGLFLLYVEVATTVKGFRKKENRLKS